LWPLDLGSSTSQSLLSDILVFVPGLLEDKSALDQAHNQGAQEDLICRLTLQLWELYNWRWEWDYRNAEFVTSDKGIHDESK
jgi:hypothetical protein